MDKEEQTMPLAIYIVPKTHGGVDIGATAEISPHELLTFITIAQQKVAIGILQAATQAEMQQAAEQAATSIITPPKGIAVPRRG